MPPEQSKLLVLTEPEIVPLLLHAPAKLAAGTMYPATWSHATDGKFGHVTAAAPAPVTVTVHVVLSGLLHWSVPEYDTVKLPPEQSKLLSVTLPGNVPLLLQPPV